MVELIPTIEILKAFKLITQQDINLRNEIIQATNQFRDYFFHGAPEEFEGIFIQTRLFNRNRRPSFLEDEDFQPWISIKDGLIDWGEGLYHPDLDKSTFMDDLV